MNQGITILQDYSAGSNATTMLCMDAEKTFYRKYAFGADGDKLAEQLAWLRTQQDRLPLCDILQSSTEDGCCWYDMVYDPQAVGLFRYLHSNPVEKSTAIPGGAGHVGRKALPSHRPPGGYGKNRAVHR